MAEVIRMPLLSDTMKEGVIARWNKQVGDTVKSDESIADVETDKATMEVIPYVDGTLLYIGVEAGKAAKVNDIIAIIGKPGEAIDGLLDQAEAKSDSVVAAPVSEAPTPTTVTASVSLPKDITVIRMPLLSDTMKEGKIVVWNKQVGDPVKADDALAEVETDKATMEVIGYADGVLLYQGVKAGEAAAVNAVIAVVGKAGTDLSPYMSVLSSSNKAEASTKTEASNKAEASTKIEASNKAEASGKAHVDASDSGRVKASPLAKQIAREKGIDLRSIHGSGDNGRIVKRDVDAALAAPKVAVNTTQAPVAAQFQGEESYTDIPVTQMRKVIAQRLSESKFTAPHFYLKVKVGMDALLEARKKIIAQSDIKISVNDFIIKAVAMALEKHPDVNSSWMGDTIRRYNHIHIGSAIALEEGLIVPVIRHANKKSLSAIAADAASLYDKARNKKIQPQEFSGNTFTISNLGMMGIDEFTAIVNPPDACILAVGKTTPTPVVEGTNIVVRQIMTLTLSCDHRVVDGAVGARFMQTLKNYIEEPLLMFV
ncbi:MAG: pyruvate dehydrogenase complex dihydrolipoamide acetyltransferase [Chitinophagaceae bacterium]|nr:pyruvate dehydrogenase complex dihydrolipoamide acetyltransferase [Chitinophagaceae bacterium]